uniref:Uncharacterized protein n=1 Tax=Arundo donax TaxID=35708 RepID=A0A0A9EWF6_ARUDO
MNEENCQVMGGTTG